jgi:hypothetical protein
MALTKISRSLLDTGISDSSDATAITIDSSEQVGIGVSPSATLQLKAASGNTGLYLQDASGSPNISWLDAGGTVQWQIYSTMGGANGLDPLVIYSSSGEVARIDTSGNVGIGTTTINSGTLGTSNTFLEVSAGTASGSGTLILSRNSSTNDVELGGVRFVNANNADDDGLDADGKLVAAMSARSVTSDSNAGDDSGANLVFYTKPEAGNYAERLRITSDGNVGIGVTAPTNTFVVGHASHGVAIDHVSSLPSQAGMFTSSSATTAQAYGDLVVKSRTDYSGYGIGFYTASSGGSPLQRMALIDSGALYLYNQNSGAGNADLRYSTSTGAVTYDTSSRLVKDKIEPIPYGLETVLSLSPKKYIRTDSDNEVEVGFIADEIEKVIPELVGMMEKSNFTDNEEDTELIAGSVDYKKLTAVLTKAIQEQQEQIEALQSEINTLKGE